MTYEYKVIEAPVPPKVKLLDDMALDNWELVAIIEFSVIDSRFYTYFKRITA